jgi:PKHD-type hydroxylase
MLYPVGPKHSPGKDTHAYWENFLSEDQINYILDKCNEKTSPATIGGAKEELILNQSIRSTEVNWVYPSPENIDIWNKISEVVSKVNARFFKFDLQGFYEPMQLGVYKAENNGHYNWHVDAANSDNNTPRKLSIVLLLSDPSEFEGGELQIKTNSDVPKTLELKKGRAWFFPSYVLHRVTPVTKGVRKSLVLWVGGPEFK